MAVDERDVNVDLRAVTSAVLGDRGTRLRLHPSCFGTEAAAPALSANPCLPVSANSRLRGSSFFPYSNGEIRGSAPGPQKKRLDKWAAT